MKNVNGIVEDLRLAWAIIACIPKRKFLKDSRWPPCRWILGHRGARSVAPENTLTSFRRAMELGADGVEFDVVPSRDGIPIVIHDDTLERTTNGVGIVWNYDYAELVKFDATKLIAGFKAESIPTLQDTLVMLPDDALVNIELKNNGHLTKERFVDRVLADIEGHEHRLRILVSSFDAELLQILRARRVRFLVALLLSKRDAHWRRALELMPAIAPDALHLSPDLPTRLIRVLARAAGMQVAVWTINDPAFGNWLFARGIDGIFTDHVHELVVALRKKSSQ